MYLKPDFDTALRDAVLSRPAVAAAYRAGDPRLVAQMDALATMLAMLSQQIDLAEVEPFVKAREGTVLADAALKGVLPLGRPARVSLIVDNPGTSAVTLAAGRTVLDTKGLRYSVEASATINPSDSGTITVVQSSVRQVSHTVAGSAPFYSVLIPASADGLHVVGIEVEDNAGALTYTPEFCNVEPGQRVFHVETDEYRRLWLRFGARDGVPVVGWQPLDGDVLTITLTECEGAVELESASRFSLEYAGTTAEGLLTLTLDEVQSPGANPPSMELLRLLARYPALHDSNAVFLSNFDFVLRRHLPPVKFLSVWNEQIEEAARGANVTNINKLFVAYVIDGQTAPVSEAQIRAIVARADNSLRVVFVAPNPIAVPLTVNAQVSVVHDPGDVEAQIRTALLEQYGLGSIAAARGLGNTFRFQFINDLLRSRVTALQDQVSDFTVVVGTTPTPLPEDFRYVTTGSLTVNVTRIQQNTGLWNG